MSEIALVTGANTGIGFEAVRALAGRGMTVYLGSRDAAKGEAAAAELAGAGDVRPLRLEMQDEPSLAAALAAIEQAHGRLDVLINNAGVSPRGSVLEDDPDTVLATFATNVHGPVRLTQLAVPLLRKSGNARVINVSTRASQTDYLVNEAPAVIPYSYCASKAALNAATILFAKALAPEGIRVNACCPGYTRTQVTRFMATRTPAEGARILIELALQGKDGPTGGFFNEQGRLDW